MPTRGANNFTVCLFYILHSSGCHFFYFESTYIIPASLELHVNAHRSFNRDRTGLAQHLINL